MYFCFTSLLLWTCSLSIKIASGLSPFFFLSYVRCLLNSTCVIASSYMSNRSSPLSTDTETITDLYPVYISRWSTDMLVLFLDHSLFSMLNFVKFSSSRNKSFLFYIWAFFSSSKTSLRLLSNSFRIWAGLTFSWRTDLRLMPFRRYKRLKEVTAISLCGNHLWNSWLRSLRVLPAHKSSICGSSK